MEFSRASDIDNFFFYGEGDLDDEIEVDVWMGLMQPKRSLFYFRSEGCGVSERENFPNSLAMQVGIRYDVANWAANRNAIIGDGSSDGKDRRVVISQNSVSFVVNSGDLDIEVAYIPFKDVKNRGRIVIPVIGGI